MRHYVILKKRTKTIKTMRIYGSIKALLENENILIDGVKPNYNRMMYLLKPGHKYEDKNIIIKRCEVISKKVINK